MTERCHSEVQQYQINFLEIHNTICIKECLVLPLSLLALSLLASEMGVANSINDGNYEFILKIAETCLFVHLFGPLYLQCVFF
jgi:hypothetical protein